MTDFDKLSAEQREEWRASETTQAFVALILRKKRTESEVVADVIKATTPLNPAFMHHLGGKLTAYDELFFDIMRK